MQQKSNLTKQELFLEVKLGNQIKHRWYFSCNSSSYHSSKQNIPETSTSECFTYNSGRKRVSECQTWPRSEGKGTATHTSTVTVKHFRPALPPQTGDGCLVMWAVDAAVVPPCLCEFWRAETHHHGLSGNPLHICQTPRCGDRLLGPDVGDHSTVLSRRQGAGLPWLCEAVCPHQLHRSSATWLPVCPAAVHGADRWASIRW